MESLPLDTSHPAVRDYLALVRLQVLTPLTLLLNIAATTVCATLANPTLQHVLRLHPTVFSPSTGVVAAYVGVVALGMVGYCLILVVVRKEETKAAVIKGVGPSLVIANITMALWSIAWVLQWFLACTILQGLLLLLLIYANINLLIYHPPSRSRPLDTALIHAPLRFFLVLPLNILFPLCLFITLGFSPPPTSPIDPSHPAWHPTTGLLVLLGINLVELVVIVARHDLVWCVAAVWVNVALWAGRAGNGKPGEIYITAIVLTALHPLALVTSISYQWFVRRREGRIALPVDGEEGRNHVNGQPGLGRAQGSGPREVDDTWG
ncbi:hypothetical protein BJ165DRAFT_1478385 [Panaeolus papilionaceus]|nr:hypothetical protein BJ165DRAFT_1478385 [Panaeolus papilionaceus]